MERPMHFTDDPPPLAPMLFTHPIAPPFPPLPQISLVSRSPLSSLSTYLVCKFHTLFRLIFFLFFYFMYVLCSLPPDSLPFAACPFFLCSYSTLPSARVGFDDTASQVGYWMVSNMPARSTTAVLYARPRIISNDL